MKPEDLIKYELPSITEFVSNRWLQGFIGRYYGKKVNRKFNRYQKRLNREKFLNIINSHKYD